MPARSSESFILQTYPFRESDLIVSFFTRDQGKLRGVARRARRPKSSFGSALERLSHANVSYYQKENRELVSLNSCELVHCIRPTNPGQSRDATHRAGVRQATSEILRRANPGNTASR